jgi:hypothetical protein
MRFSLATSNLTVISRKTRRNPFCFTHFFLEPILSNSQKIWFPWISLEITAKSKVYSEDILAGT